MLSRKSMGVAGYWLADMIAFMMMFEEDVVFQHLASSPGHSVYSLRTCQDKNVIKNKSNGVVLESMV